jgi:hypothetical protein
MKNKTKQVGDVNLLVVDIVPMWRLSDLVGIKLSNSVIELGELVGRNQQATS